MGCYEGSISIGRFRFWQGINFEYPLATEEGGGRGGGGDNIVGIPRLKGS